MYFLLAFIFFQVLIVCPTREIAEQTQSAIKAIGSAMPELKSRCFIGGKELKVDQNSCKKCHIAVGTPGRLCQLVDEKHLKLDHIRLMVSRFKAKFTATQKSTDFNYCFRADPR